MRGVGKTDASTEMLGATYRMTLIGGVLFFVLLVGELCRVQFATYGKEQLRVTTSMLVGRAVGIDRVVHSGHAYVDVMRGDATEMAGPPVQSSRSIAWPSSPTRDDADEPAQEASGNIIRSSQWEGSPGVRRDLAIVEKLASQQRMAHRAGPNLTRSFYLSRDAVLQVYPWISSTDLLEGAGVDDIDGLFDALYAGPAWQLGAALDVDAASPADWWTEPHVGLTGDQMVVSCVAPVSQGGEVIAIVGTSVDLAGMADWVSLDEDRPGELLLLSKAGQVLAMTGREIAAQMDPVPFADVLPERLREEGEALLEFTPDGDGVRRTRHERLPDHKKVAGYEMLMKARSDRPWRLVGIIARRGLVTGFVENSGIYGVVILGLALFLLITHALMRYHYVKPAIGLVNHIRTEAIAGPTPIPDVPAEWVQWFKEISDTLPLKAVAANLPGAVFQFIGEANGSSRLAFVSRGVVDLTGVSVEEAPEYLGRELEFIVEEDLPGLLEASDESAKDLSPLEYECRLKSIDGGQKWVQVIGRPRKGDAGEIIWDGVVLDVNARKLAEEERERLIVELQEALAQIKTLEGLLPICASCKAVRDDTGYWKQIESYVREHSDAEFTHSICPDCAQKLYPEFTGDEDDV